MTNNKMDETIKEVMERERRNSQALSMLLTQQREKDGHLLALGLRMGKTPSYLATVSLGWVAQHIHFAGDLPIFKKKGDKVPKAVTVDAETVEDIQQRRPDWRRQLPMAAYLAMRPNRKFPPLLVVGYQSWVYNPKADAWGDDKRALKDSVNAIPLEPKSVYYDLDAKDTNYYALDGQHRLMAILGLKDLLSKGRLVALNREGEPQKKSHTQDEVVGEICQKTGEDEAVVHERLQRIMHEDHIGIEIIPAVVNGESYTEARSRLRGVFVDVNENAKKPTKSDSVLLEENNGFRIVARRVMVEHNLLKDGKVQQGQGQLHEDSPCYTTLESLVEIARAYLRPKKMFSGWENPLLGDRSIGFIRPDETEIEEATAILHKYLDVLASDLPSHIQFLQGKPAADIRGYAKAKGKSKEDNILFRPIAQVALAKAVATLEKEHEKTPVDVIRRLGEQEEKGQLKLHEKGAPWFGVLSDPIDGKMRRHKSYQILCERLLVYMLGGGIQDDKMREELRRDFASARRTAEEDKSVNLDGKAVTFKVDADGKTVLENKVQLPLPW